MGWAFLGIVVAVLALSMLFLLQRRLELAHMARGAKELEVAKHRGTHRARLQHPVVDLSRCIGCGICVKACPEDGVLEMIHGQAVVVHGARCVGHARCAAECPVGAIAVTLGDLEKRTDIPVLSDRFESTRVPGLFLAGEVTGYALIRTAIAQGTTVANQVADRVQGSRGDGERSGRAQRDAAEPVLDLCVVGAGPAGLACSLQAKARGLSFVTLEQAELGGTVSKYPRRKLVMTQPVHLPLHGKLEHSTYSKEDLMALWLRVVDEHQLPIRAGEELVGVSRAPQGHLVVETRGARIAARNVCLALGRRGTPRKLGVPGEELSKVAYSLLDAQSYTGRRILVVGGGDSAIEAALGLGDQPGNRVTLSYRQANFSRLKARNEAHLAEAVKRGKVELLMESAVTRIEESSVHLDLAGGRNHCLPNDEVFVLIGGTPPFQLLEAAGVSFDPAERQRAAPLAEQGTGFLKALGGALALALCALAWALAFSGYYALEPHERLLSVHHALLKPTGPFGLACGVAASALILANLAYLLRRSQRFAWIKGSLQGWMTSHVVTGITAFLLVLLHAGLAPEHTVGGHAFVALSILVVTGAIGRYFYSFVPRAANGRELALEEVRARLAALSGEWDRHNRAFGDSVRAEVQRLQAEHHWHASFLRRVGSLVSSHRELRATVARLRARAAREGIAEDQIDALVMLARRAQRTALAAAHYEDVRALLASWRYFHRWVALAMVLLAALHIATAFRYASIGG